MPIRRHASGPLLVAIALAVAAIGVLSSAIVLSAPADPVPAAGPTEPSSLSPADASGTPAGGDGSRAVAPRTVDGADRFSASAAGPEADQEVVAETTREPLVIVHTGDVNLDPSYVPVLREHGPDAVWAGVSDTLAGADLAIANLECPVGTGGTAEQKQYLFRCDPAALPAMRAAGVDVVTLANNHSGDYGMAAMLASVDVVEQAGMATVGVGADEASAQSPALFDIGGWRVAVLGFGGVAPSPDWIAHGETPGQASGYDTERMTAAVAAAAELADLVVVSVHWGEEGALEPRPEDRRKANAMVAAGADLIVGHHAHRLQPVERIDDASVFWNMGNFVWPRFSADGARTAIAQWTVEPDGKTQACLLPAEIDADGRPAPTGARPICT